MQAVDGLQALDLLRSEQVDLMLLDIMMPELVGYGVLGRRREDPRLRDIQVIVISAADEIVSVARCITLGAEDYLPTPFKPALLKARVEPTLERKRRHDVAVATLRDTARLTEAAIAIEAGGSAATSS